MRRERRGFVKTASASLLFLAACVTVNIYFPAAQVEEAAKQIVDDVYGEKAPGPQSGRMLEGLRLDWLSWLGPREAHAEEATTVSNAAIRALKEQIAERHRQLLPYYQKGQVGIDREGYLEVRDTSGLNLPQTASLKRLVEADNAARRQLYAEVARALNIQPQQVDQVREIFAREWRDKAERGWWVQGDDGQWKKR